MASARWYDGLGTTTHPPIQQTDANTTAAPPIRPPRGIRQGATATATPPSPPHSQIGSGATSSSISAPSQIKPSPTLLPTDPPDPNRPKGFKLGATKKAPIYKRYALTLKGAKLRHIKYNIPWEETKMRMRAGRRGVGCLIFLVVGVVAGLIAYFIIKGQKDEKERLQLLALATTIPTPEWLTRWDNKEYYPTYCITPKDAVYEEIRCHGVSSVPDLELVRGTILHAYFSNNTWTRIGSKPFDYMPNLTHLDLTSSSISVINDNAFNMLTRLNTLKLSHNDLNIVNGSFLSESFRDLQRLYLVQTNIRNITSGAFRNLHGVRQLFLSSNLLEQIPPDLFKFMMNLTELWLDKNFLTNIVSTLFSNTINLRIIHLEENYLTEIKAKTFSILPFFNNEGTVSLANNSITQIADGAFPPNAVLNELFLDGNEHLNCSSVDFLPIARHLSGIPKACSNKAPRITCHTLNCTSKNRTCRSSVIGPRCLCKNGYTGDDCDIDEDECKTYRPCYSGTVCLNTQGSYRCVYAKKVEGTKKAESFPIVWIIAAGLIIISAFGMMFYYSKKSESQNQKVMSVDEPVAHGRRPKDRKHRKSSGSVVKRSVRWSRGSRGSRGSRRSQGSRSKRTSRGSRKTY